MLYKLSKVPVTSWHTASEVHALQNGKTSNGAECCPKFGICDTTITACSQISLLCLYISGADGLQQPSAQPQIRSLQKHQNTDQFAVMWHGTASAMLSLVTSKKTSVVVVVVVVCGGYLGEGLVEGRACRHFGELPYEHGGVAGGRQLKGQLKGKQAALPRFCKKHTPNEFGMWSRSCIGDIN